ncbi:MAG: glycosyl hydrolase family 39 [Candidatus Sulfotelmatobacter sp.]
MLRVIIASLLLVISADAALAQTAETIVIDGSAPAHPFPHFWEQMFGSGRAILSLREDYRQDLQAVKQITGFRYVRFHAVFDDEIGVYDEDKQGQPVFNFSYVDQIYDGLLAKSVRPFVELSFMPNKLAAKPILQAFWYKPDVSPPKDWTKWDDLITQFAKHLVDRYGIDEVSHWYFEVWNEPNIDFWAGNPKQATYWDLYDHTARAVKAVSPRLRIGGPATAQAAWADAFIQHCAVNHVPVDFVSTHVYGNDLSKDVFGTDENIPRDKMVCRAVKKVHDQIAASPMPKLPLIWSEFNASYFNEPAVTDASYMGPWLADTVRQCDGLVDMMSYWTFSDVFEEQGVVKTPFYGGFGLLAEDGIPKPAFNAFKILHRLGEQRIDVNSDSALLTRKKDGSLVLAIWTYAPREHAGTAKTVTLHFEGGHYKRALVSTIDPSHGDVHSIYEKMGSPPYPSEAQIQQLKQAAEISPAAERNLKGGELILTLPSYALAVVEIR